jgi:hypothetical protein
MYRSRTGLPNIDEQIVPTYFYRITFEAYDRVGYELAGGYIVLPAVPRACNNFTP